MLTDLDCANLCQALYDGIAVFDKVETLAGVSYSVKEYDDCLAIVFEGSHDMPDWLHDFQAIMIRPPSLNGIGVHQGFYNGLETVLSALIPTLKPIIITGHSLGAGRAPIFAAMLLEKGAPVKKLVLFGAPNPGDMNLVKRLYTTEINSYWNYSDGFSHDIVCDVPCEIYPLLPYTPVRQRIQITVRPDPADAWGFMGWHHMHYYQQGLRARGDNTTQS